LLGGLAVSVAFSYAGLGFGTERSFSGYACATFFGITGLVFAVQLLPNGSYLRLTPEGFTYCSLFRRHTFRWSDVQSFSTVRVGRNEMVVWDYARQYKKQQLGRAVSRGIAHAEAALPDTYGLKAPALAALMNTLRRQHVLPEESQRA
jgi:hypothetical protein